VLGREAVERNTGTGLAYFEWSADPGCDIEDPRVWRSCMPALGHTITEADIAIELEAMSKRPNDFRRAYLNLWVPKDAPDEQVIDPVLWGDLFDERSKAKAVTAFGFDVQPGNVSAAVGHAGLRADGLMDVEVVHAESGTDWCVPFLVARWLKHRVPIVLDPTSPAGAFQAELERRGVKVVTVDTRQYGHACQAFVTEAEARRLRHRGWTSLDTALACAKTRNIGDGGIGWARKTVSADISPLVAVTLAMWAATNAAKPRNFWGAIA
jgi:phage terminase large subunit-like protein